jgi:hypothetical protein
MVRLTNLTLLVPCKRHPIYYYPSVVDLNLQKILTASIIGIIAVGYQKTNFGVFGRQIKIKYSLGSTKWFKIGNYDDFILSFTTEEQL